VTATDLVDRLAQHKTLGAAPREELEWLAAHGTLWRLAAGDWLAKKGQPVEHLHILFTGHVAHYSDRGAGRNKVMEWRAGSVTGVLPYSRMGNAPGDSVVQEATELLAIPVSSLPEMIRECNQVTTILVHTMLDRSRIFSTSGLHDEKMVSLGKLSAGLAHELNNPAAAIERSAALLDDRLAEAERAMRALGASRLTDQQLAAIENVRTTCLAVRPTGVLSPIQQAEREDAISDWLHEHRVGEAVAGALADTQVTVRTLDKLAAVVEGQTLDAVLQSIAAECSLRELASSIQEAAMRISGLVMAIKGFTHMDQAAVAEPVDLASSLGNTVTVLKSKARAKSAGVNVSVEPGLPKVRGFASELNQIWANLIDNALDAVPKDSGRVDVTATRELQRVVVRVIDNGAGIPDSVRSHLFEPFFTTKPVGQGTGLGLDIVRRLVSHNDAEIDVETRPGRTEFRVSLPLAEGAAAGSKA
jgi:signal transduction histidine kinase